MARLVLASSSPRGQDLLKMLVLDFLVMPSTIEEEQFNGLPPEEMVMALSKAKAEEIGKSMENALVIGSDTIVVLEGKVLGKPSNSREAIEMLKGLRNKEHTVITGLAVYDSSSGRIELAYDQTRVYMGSISDDDIINYVKTGEPMDKAGGYGIQGIGGAFIDRINGSYYTVVGLPIHKLVRMLKEFGVSIFQNK